MEKLSKLNKIFNRLYYNLFIENFNKKIKYNFPLNFHRWDLIDYLIKKNNYTDYLEIGCDQNQLFSKIKIKNKVGVDPFSGGNIRKTSDQFFQRIIKNLILFLQTGCMNINKLKKIY